MLDYHAILPQERVKHVFFLNHVFGKNVQW